MSNLTQSPTEEVKPSEVSQLKAEVKKLKEDNLLLYKTFYASFEWSAEDIVSMKKIKEENETLKQNLRDRNITLTIVREDNEKLKEENLVTLQDALKNKLDLVELKQENELLKEQKNTLEDIHQGGMNIAKMLKEKWNDEQEKNKKLKEEIDRLEKECDERVAGDDHDALMEENKKLKEAAKFQVKQMEKDADNMAKLFQENEKLKENSESQRTAISGLAIELEYETGDSCRSMDNFNHYLKNNYPKDYEKWYYYFDLVEYDVELIESDEE